MSVGPAAVVLAAVVPVAGLVGGQAVDPVAAVLAVDLVGVDLAVGATEFTRRLSSHGVD